jgi:hypothetical protein
MRVSRSSLIVAAATGMLALPTGAVHAAASQDDISYASQPDRLAIFLNGIAYGQDAVSLPGGVDVRVVLPDTVMADTVILRENGERVPSYRLDRRSGPPTIAWQSGTTTALRDISLEYLLGGVSWRPTYDLWLGADTDESVDLDFLAEITDSSLRLEDVDTRLVAGVVEIGSAFPADVMAEMSANQELAGYAAPVVTAVPTGQVNIQHVYDIGPVTAEPGDTAYLRMAGQTLPARRLHLWNAPTDNQVSVIYKVLNETELPFAEGIVRAYQADMFIGSDMVETTPVGSEGSITVGRLRDVRVERKQGQTVVSMGRFDYRNEVVLTLSSFGPTAVEVEVVDYRPPEAEQMSFSTTPEQEPGNVMRWIVTVEPGATETITYDYLVD